MRLIAACLLGLALFSVCSAQRVEILKEEGIVSDYADVIDNYSKERVKRLADELKRITSVQYRVVVLHSLEMMQVVDAQAYGQQLFDRWDIGQAKEGLEHGVLLLISIVDRQVKIILGRQVEKILPQEEKEKMEWAIMAELSRGNFSGGIEIGSGLIVQHILVHWPTMGPWRIGLNWEKASLPFFILTIVSIALTLVTGGNFIMGFSMLVGGVFGYIFMGVPGLMLVASLAFFINYGRSKS
jgi:uncharacterized membrane protein YgcG